MEITRLRLKNWRNFRQLDVPLRDTTYILGPNASGKSNLLDVFRFLRDDSKTNGGGLQSAVEARGGITKVRCLHARRDPEVLIDVELSVAGQDAAGGRGHDASNQGEDSAGPYGQGPDAEAPAWRYILGFKPEGKGAQRLLISREEVWRGGECLFERPDRRDKVDPVLLTQTRLEQIATNADFRPLAEFFGSLTYLHLVPQLLRYAEQIGGRRLEDDPFGQGFLERISSTPEKTRNSRLAKISGALSLAVPQFDELRFLRDDAGRPHLEARYKHYRPHAGWQSEVHFSDGTLRLLALLWSFLEGNSLLLLEEPEISLNDAVVKEIPLIIQRLQRNRKLKRQIVISTHSEALLSNPGIDGRGVILLETGADGSKGRSLLADESQALQAGLSVAEVVLPKARPEPKRLEQLALW